MKSSRLTDIIFLFMFFLTMFFAFSTWSKCHAQENNFWSGKYEWTQRKAIGQGLLLLGSIADGMNDRFVFEQRKSFMKFGVDPVSFWGEDGYLLYYKDHDPSKGPKSFFHWVYGAPDFYHFSEDIGILGAVSGTILIGSEMGWHPGKWEWWLDVILVGVIRVVGHNIGQLIIRKI